jgi:hypothetical protein
MGLHELEARVGAQEFETRLLELRIVISVEIVEADDVTPFAQEPARDMKAEEAGCARDQYCPIRHPIPKTPGAAHARRPLASLPTVRRGAQYPSVRLLPDWL